MACRPRPPPPRSGDPLSPPARPTRCPAPPPHPPAGHPPPPLPASLAPFSCGEPSWYNAQDPTGNCENAKAREDAISERTGEAAGKRASEPCPGPGYRVCLPAALSLRFVLSLTFALSQVPVGTALPDDLRPG